MNGYFTAPIRKIIYTTNQIEGYHRQIRKITKTKGAFANETALLKLMYLGTKNIEKKWSKSAVQNWSLTIAQLDIHFPDRLKLRLN